MSVRVLRSLVAIVTALVVWSIATPARAAAPMCDPRGASAFAPAPTLVAPMTSIDLGLTQDDGCHATLDAHVTYREGRAPITDAPQAPMHAALTSNTSIAPCPMTKTSPAGAEYALPRPGIRDRLDRPPRV